ncbi:MAG: TlpA family protein disulfide reductase [Gammaproteobacteria bacterium]|nr:TlpA family protein disulfide reductase [Gammaproteobacteria bacterium]MBL6999967.1 TlpA family protein disulfide reductase [Gammaproteobacteria bacterium]
MKLLLLCLFALNLLVISVPALADSELLKPYTGNLNPPELTLDDLQGKPHSLTDYKGNIVLVQFWATYCTPCRKEMPSMNRLIKKMADKPFKIIAVDMAESQDTVQQFLQQVPVDFAVLLDRDGSSIGAWKVFAAPANFILDKQGNIIYTLYGAIEWDSDEMVEKLSALTLQ